MSYTRSWNSAGKIRFPAEWCLRSELNQRHADFQSAALPTELQRQIWVPKYPNMATRKGLEPSTSGVTGRRSNQLNYRAIGGNNRARTCDPMLVRHVLSQLSYAPIGFSLPKQRSLLYKTPPPLSTIFSQFLIIFSGGKKRLIFPILAFSPGYYPPYGVSSSCAASPCRASVKIFSSSVRSNWCTVSQN